MLMNLLCSSKRRGMVELERDRRFAFSDGRTYFYMYLPV
jgi:hypothetical protein